MKKILNNKIWAEDEMQFAERKFLQAIKIYFKSCSTTLEIRKIEIISK